MTVQSSYVPVTVLSLFVRFGVLPLRAGDGWRVGGLCRRREIECEVGVLLPVRGSP